MVEETFILEGKGLRKEFGSLVAVADVDIRVRAGELHAIIGPNGAGKTTLFNLLSGNLHPTGGTVWFKGRDITTEPLHRRVHLGIGRSFQITNIFPSLTVLENVRLAAQALGGDSFKFWWHFRRFAQYTETALTAIAQVGLSDKLAVPAAVLPHGDQRKLELAILLASDAELLLLDEPTAGMATEQVPPLMETIRAIQRGTGKTIMLVEHNMNVVMTSSDRITVMHLGAVLAEGTPAEIARNETVQQAYLGELYGDFAGIIGGAST
ncbi:MAG: ABC transporter ATP-binding protein [Anaerolineae bacterium]|nr:ABC transporter ATP-binding protein [Anaerolineae bacterium]